MDVQADQSKAGQPVAPSAASTPGTEPVPGTEPASAGMRARGPVGHDAAYVARVGVIAAVYAACTLVALTLLGSLAWGPVQLRVSEALCVLALFTPAAAPGLTLGCAIANAANIVLSGTGMLGLLDVVFGSFATYLGARWAWRMRRRPLVALAGPVLSNAIIVPAYLPLLLMGIGYYTIPFTSISLESSYLFMYLFGLVATGAGEAVIMYALGYPLYRALAKNSLMRRELEQAEHLR